MQKKLELLQRIAKELNHEKIEWGLGGSLLLFVRGITDQFGDIDLLVKDSEVLRVNRLLNKMGMLVPKEEDPIYHTKGFFQFEIDGVIVQVMSNLTVKYEDKLYTVPFDEFSIDKWEPFGQEKLPLMYLEDWYVIYQLIQRTPKVELLEEHFKKVKFSKSRKQALLEWSLPADIRETLREIKKA